MTVTCRPALLQDICYPACVLEQGLVAGVAFSKLSNADNVGYIIPWIIVQHFRAEYETHGEFRGCCSGRFLSNTCQSCATLLRLSSSTFVTTLYA